MKKVPPLNPVVKNIAEYASKAISIQVEKMNNIMNLSFGEPEFGPPSFLKEEIITNGLSWDAFIHSVKGYEKPRGDFELRKSISKWYKKNYGLEVDPEDEIMITHGGVEAITLAILCTTETQQGVVVSNPSYMLYERSITVLNRNPIILNRPVSGSQYKDSIKTLNEDNIGLMIINSPENPSGYVLNAEDWGAVEDYVKQHNVWVVHDEVYDKMAFTEQHRPALSLKKLRENTIMINSFSKKFGMPGLRIGWMVGPAKFIDAAAKVHDYLYLGVNKQYEKIGTLILNSPHIDNWLAETMSKIQYRMDYAVSVLKESKGYKWTRQPAGAMFLFPDISNMYKSLDSKWKNENKTKGECVAEYLLHEKGVAVVPGYVYGENSNNNIRMVLCTTDDVFNEAIKRLVE